MQEINTKNGLKCLCVDCKHRLEGYGVGEMIFCKTKGSFVYPSYTCVDYGVREEEC
jgi:hypothetical protein